MQRSIVLMMFALILAATLNAATINGHVSATDMYGNTVVPASIVDVLQAHDPGMQLVGRTDINMDGTYSVSGLPIGQFYVRAGCYDSEYYPEFYPDAHNWHDAELISISEPAQIISAIDFSLECVYHEGDAHLNGWVTDPEGNPVDHAQVYLYRLDDGWQYNLSTETNDSGHFEFEHLPGQTLYLAVLHAGYEWYYYPGAPNMWDAEPLDFSGQGEIEDLHCILQPYTEANVFGVVTGADGEPIQDATVTAISTVNQTHSTVETEHNGHFEMALTAGEYLIRADAQGYQPQFYDRSRTFRNAERLVVNGTETEIDFSLTPESGQSGSISGRIIIDGETPSIPCMVIAISSDEEEGWEESTVMAMDGNYRIPNLPVGDYFVYAVSSATPPLFWPDAYHWEGAQVVSVTEAATNIDFSLSSVADNGLVSVNGLVSQDGRTPLSNAAVVVIDANNVPMGYALSDDSGSFTVPGLAPGVYNLVATKAYYSTVTQIEILGDATTINFVLNHSATGNDTEAQVVPPATQPTVYPNPFNPQTTVSFTLPCPGRVEADIYNLRGQRVNTLYSGTLEQGEHEIVWNGTNDRGMPCASGLYFLRMQTAESTTIVKMALLK
jgi:5-hydroxyisourate hydrolase-like protein (transthyretin family)